MLPDSNISIINSLAVVIYRIKNNEVLIVESISEKVVDVTGYSVNDFIQMLDNSYSKIINPDDRVNFFQVEKKEYSRQYRIFTRDNEVKYISDKGICVYDDFGQIIKFEGIFWEISKEEFFAKEEIEKLRLSEKKYKLLTEKSRDGIVIIQEGKLQYLNPGFEKLMGYKMDEVLGKEFISFVSEEKKSQLIEYHKKRLEGIGVPNLYETEILKKDGTPMDFEINVGTVNYQGNPAVIGTLRDISDRKKIQKEINSHIDSLHKKQKELETAYSSLENSEKKLKEINASKDKFFSIIAHDLKSPFTTLLGISDFLLDEYGNLRENEQKELLSDLRTNIKSVYNLLENLLEWSHLHIKQNIAEHSNFSLAMLCDFVFEIFKLKAIGRNIELSNKIDKSVLVYADYNMVDTVIRNIVQNALKYTPKGGTITLSAEEEGGFIITSVKDTGTGIPEEVIDKLFKIDEQYTTDGIHGETGTGLGLVLCHELLKHNKGSIWVESKVNCGSNFFVKLPSGMLE
ncbi:MAG: PAS domain S-box protein [Rhodothermaceae bacterium]